MLRTTLCLLVLTSALVAQADSLLVIQRPQDRRGRDVLYQRLARVRVDVAFEDAPIKDVARYFTAATGDKVNFLVMTKGAEIEPLSLEVKRVPLTTVMQLTQRFAKVRFVYRAGLVLIQPASEVVEYTYARIYDVRAATAVIPNRPGPELTLARDDDDFGGLDDEDEGSSASGFTPDKLVDLVRANVLPESWDADNVTIDAFRGVIWVRQTETGHREVVALLRQLGAISTPRRVVRRVRPTSVRRHR